MSLLPSTLAVMMVMLLISASTRLSQDAALSLARAEQEQLAVARAELLLQRAAMELSSQADTQQVLESNSPDTEVMQAGPDGMHAENPLHLLENSGTTPESALNVARFNVADNAELSDLPLQIVRITAIGKYASVRVRLQADYAIDQCADESDNDANDHNNANNNANINNACHGRIRRIAWRRLPD